MKSQPPRPPILDLAIELGISRMASMVGERDQMPYRPRICVLVDHSSGMILHFELSQPDDSEPSLITRALNQLGQRLGGLPRQIFTRSPSIATQFKGPLQQIGVDVVVRESLPMVDEAMTSLADGPLAGGTREKGLMTLPGMTLDHVIAFAEAAKLFYEAAPWHYLCDDDLIEIESPAGPRGTRFTQVLGAGGKTMGLGFVATRALHEQMREGQGLKKGVAYWNLLFNLLDEIPFEDGELWEHHNLPVANERAYPRLARYTASSGLTHPKTEDLVWAEGLLRALAASTEAEFDTGRWEKQVQTIKGPALYRFSMPILLEQIQADAQPARPSTPPHTQAQKLCERARKARGRRIVQLARQALAIDPDCCQSLLILAGLLSEDQSKTPVLEKAVEAGARQLGGDFFAKNTGQFGQFAEAEDYLDARKLLAGELLDAGETDAGIAHLRALLELDRADRKGNRYHLSIALLLANRLDELDELLNDPQYQDDPNAEWQYTRTLLAYRREGDTPAARQQLEQAIKRNPLVARLLTGAGLTRTPFAPDEMDEAMGIAEVLAQSWHEAEGAVDWLKTRTASTVTRAGATGTQPKKKKR
jgi:tetratricopeptide (TPR) repeat protein